jgi:hypothetical protein
MWLDGLNKQGLVLRENVNGQGFTVTHLDPNSVESRTRFDLEQPGWWVSLYFRGKLTPETPIETLNNNFVSVVFNRLPTPGLNLPGWDVKPMTPSSHVSKGVEILSYRDGKIKVRVQTKFFELYGSDPSIVVPCGAPSPPGSYFAIRKEFPLDLELEAPFRFN